MIHFRVDRGLTMIRCDFAAPSTANETALTATVSSNKQLLINPRVARSRAIAVQIHVRDAFLPSLSLTGRTPSSPYLKSPRDGVHSRPAEWLTKLRITCRRLGVETAKAAAAIAAPMGEMMKTLVAVGYAFAAWNLFANIRHDTLFPSREGPFSNWMVWVAMALLLQMGSLRLTRVETSRPTGACHSSNGFER